MAPRVVRLELFEQEARALLRACEMTQDIDREAGRRDTLRESRGVAALESARAKLAAAIEGDG